MFDEQIPFSAPLYTGFSARLDLYSLIAFGSIDALAILVEKVKDWRAAIAYNQYRTRQSVEVCIIAFAFGHFSADKAS